MADRHVRFREWLPDHVLRQLDEQGPVPLFSPTVVGTDGDKENKVPFPHSTTTPTPRRPRFRGAQLGISPATTSSQETLFFTPLGESIDLGEANSTLDFSLRDLDGHPMDFTPFSVLTHSTIRPAALSASKTPPTPRYNSKRSSTAFTPPLSSLSSALASTPYKSLPRLDMLSSSYLNSCTDVSTLQNIIRVLQSDPKQQLPHLLHIAQSRLEMLEKTTTVPTPFNSLHATTTAPTFTLHDSLTLSTDSGEEIEGSSIRLLKQSVVQQQQRSRPSPSVPPGQPLYLRQQLQQTENKLQRTTQELDELQQLLQTTTMKHDQSTIALQQALSSLQSKLDQQRRATEHSQAQEATYRSRVDELTRQLEQQRRDHTQAHSTYEQKQQQLSQFLKSAQRKVDVVTIERSTILKQMLQAVYNDNSVTIEVDKLTKEERDRIVTDFCLHLANSKSQLEELAAMVRATEQERRKILKAYHQVKERYIETHNNMVGLERDNRVLTTEIESLSLKLKETQDYADHVVAQQSHWDKRHQESNAVIRRLKEQIRTSDTMVPLGIYKAALETADAQQSKADEYKKQVTSLTTQVKNLTARLSKGMAPPPPPPPPPPPRVLQPTHASKNDSLLRTPLQPQASRPKSVTPPQENQPPPINAMPSSRKVNFSSQEVKGENGTSKVRAVGGRKALEEQLRRARSPRNQQT